VYGETWRVSEMTNVKEALVRYFAYGLCYVVGVMKGRSTKF
jgi:hypothetical protein